MEMDPDFDTPSEGSSALDTYEEAQEEATKAAWLTETTTSILAKLASLPESHSEIIAADGIPALVSVLHPRDVFLSVEPEPTQEAAMTTLSLLASDPTARRAIDEAGAVPLLVKVMRNSIHTMRSQDANGIFRLRAMAVQMLKQLSLDEPGRQGVERQVGVPLLLERLRNGLAEERLAAANDLANLALDPEMQVQIGDAGAIEPLLALLRGGSTDARRAAAFALSMLSATDANKRRILAAGGVPVLLDQLRGLASAVRAASSLLAARVNSPQGGSPPPGSREAGPS